jgi:hypothetical protein
VKLKTPHLDLVYLHDVEFVCEPTDPKIVNDVAPIPGAEYDESWGLLHPEKKGDGDEKILKAIEVLRELKDKGLIRAVGISGIIPSVRRPGYFLMDLCFRLPSPRFTSSFHSNSPQDGEATGCATFLWAAHSSKQEVRVLHSSLQGKG